jgi:xylulokinase
LADVPAYLALRLSGRLATPWSGIDTAGLVDLQRRDWAHPVLEAAGLEPRRLPELVPPATRVGRVTAPASRQTGVPVGTPVVAAGGDGHCFALGAATCHPRAATFTIGTSAVLGLNVERPVLSGACRTLLACSPDQYLLEGVIQCGSATVAWLEDVFAASPGGRTRGREPRGNGPDPAAAVPPGAEGLLVLPHWRGARAPHNDALARGVAVGWTDRHTLAHFRRAILEGVALEMAALLERAAAESATAPEALVLGGGGAANDTWCGIIADVTGLPCLRPDTVELTSLGAALCALAWAQGNASPLGAAGGMTLPARTFLPAPARQKVYADLRPVFARLYPATRGLSHALASLAGPAAAQ